MVFGSREEITIGFNFPSRITTFKFLKHAHMSLFLVIRHTLILG